MENSKKEVVSVEIGYSGDYMYCQEYPIFNEFSKDVIKKIEEDPSCRSHVRLFEKDTGFRNIDGEIVEIRNDLVYDGTIFFSEEKNIWVTKIKPGTFRYESDEKCWEKFPGRTLVHYPNDMRIWRYLRSGKEAFPGEIVNFCSLDENANENRFVVFTGRVSEPSPINKFLFMAIPDMSSIEYINAS